MPPRKYDHDRIMALSDDGLTPSQIGEIIGAGGTTVSGILSRIRKKQAMSYAVYHDPSGIFSRGASFSRINVRETAALGHWPAGIVFVDTTTSKMIRVVSGDEGQILVVTNQNGG